MKGIPASLCAALLLAAPLAAKPPPAHWQEAIRAEDRKRLAGLWRAWARALGNIHREDADLAALGRLVAHDAGQDGIAPPPGHYRCRLVRLGRGDNAPSGMPVVGTLPPVPCLVRADGEQLWFEQQAGAQRVAGRLWQDGGRLVFLGSMALAGEAGVMAYGSDPARDQVGVLTSLGPGHWRLELPWPRWQSDLCLVEITSA